MGGPFRPRVFEVADKPRQRRVSALRPGCALPQASAGSSATSHAPQRNTTSAFAQALSPQFGQVYFVRTPPCLASSQGHRPARDPARRSQTLQRGDRCRPAQTARPLSRSGSYAARCACRLAYRYRRDRCAAQHVEQVARPLPHRNHDDLHQRYRRRAVQYGCAYVGRGGVTGGRCFVHYKRTGD